MKFNDAGLQLIKDFESCRLQAYQDDKGIWSIGYGCTHHVTQGLVISQDEADERLKEDIDDTIRAVTSSISPRDISDNQFSACVCLVYNIGYGNFKSSTLLNCIKMGNLSDAANEFCRWNKETIDGIKQVSNGLSRRREAERVLFLS